MSNDRRSGEETRPPIFHHHPRCNPRCDGDNHYMAPLAGAGKAFKAMADAFPRAAAVPYMEEVDEEWVEPPASTMTAGEAVVWIVAFYLLLLGPALVIVAWRWAL